MDSLADGRDASFPAFGVTLALLLNLRRETDIRSDSRQFHWNPG